MHYFVVKIWIPCLYEPKYSFKADFYKKIKVTTKNTKRPKAAYLDNPKITYKKKEDLLSLLKHIPVDNHEFFKNLTAYRKGQKLEKEESYL